MDESAHSGGHVLRETTHLKVCVDYCSTNYKGVCVCGGGKVDDDDDLYLFLQKQTIGDKLDMCYERRRAETCVD